MRPSQRLAPVVPPIATLDLSNEQSRSGRQYHRRVRTKAHLNQASHFVQWRSQTGVQVADTIGLLCQRQKQATAERLGFFRSSQASREPAPARHGAQQLFVAHWNNRQAAKDQFSCHRLLGYFERTELRKSKDPSPGVAMDKFDLAALVLGRLKRSKYLERLVHVIREFRRR